jgi:hypothetical protein
MNRRKFFAAAGAVLAAPAVVTAGNPELRVVSHTVRPQKNYIIHHGNIRTVEYVSDELTVRLSDGSELRCWVDEKNMLNISGGGDDIDLLLDRSHVAEKFARQYFDTNLKVVSHTLLTGQYKEYGTGTGANYRPHKKYHADVLRVRLSDGTLVDNWMDGECFCQGLASNFHQTNWCRFYNVAEPYARKYFKCETCLS